MLDKLRASIRRSATSTRILIAALVLSVAFAGVAMAARIGPAIVGPVEGVLFFVITGAARVRARFDRGVIAILLGGLGLYLAYLGYTSFGERNYDGGPQLQYIEYIVQNHRRPPAAHCLICHHPPLYYGAGALVYAFFKATRLAAPAVGLQVFGLGLFMLFLAFGARTAERLLPERRDQRLATALMVFWPYSVHNSVRLHNDSMVCAWMAIAVFYMVRWAQEERPRDLYLGAVFTALGLLTKSSAYALVPVLLALLAARFSRSRDKVRLLGRGAAVAAILAGALVLNAHGKETLMKRRGAPLCHKILGSACDIHGDRLVDNAPGNYLYLDLPTFLQEPYAFANKDDSGRQYFWNHFLKSSLFGTHNRVADPETAHGLNRAVAEGMNILLLGMIGYLGAGLVSVKKRRLRRWAVVLLNLGAGVAFMVGFRALVPSPHHSDFRHVFHLVILVSIAYAATVAHFRASWPAMQRAGQILALPFVALSIFYFVPKNDLVLRLTKRTVKLDLEAIPQTAPEGLPWDREGNIIIEPNHTLEIDVMGLPTASELEVTFDGNDRYEIEIVGDVTRRLLVGPSKKKTGGLARYVEAIDPPVPSVRLVRVRPLAGDFAYSMGHLVLR